MSSPTNSIFTDPRDHPGRYVRRFAFHIVWIVSLAVIVSIVAGPHESLTGVQLQTADTALTHATDNLKNALSLNAVAEAQAQTDPTGEFSLANWQQSQSAVISSLSSLGITLQSRIAAEDHLNNKKKALQADVVAMAAKIPQQPPTTATAAQLSANEAPIAAAATSGQVAAMTIKLLHRCSPGVTGLICRTF